MKLIVGLGNPGKEYEHTRHNMGFDTLDLLNKTLKIDLNKEGFKGLYGKGKYHDEDIVLLKPLTLMNLSGEAVQALMAFFKIKQDDLLVISDDMALPPGKIRLRENGSSGGHKGIQNIIDNLSSNEFKRLRIGIGEPKFNSINFVLSRPTGEELKLIQGAIQKASEAILDYLDHNFHHAMSKFN
ncbi:MAG: aminoacyl-tRNA hydrolase [Bacilli bacterium]|nr:aminoacyl-tRNA hydrolase [Bacilli bacterium]